MSDAAALFEAIGTGDTERARAIVADDPAAAAARNGDGLSAVLAALYRHRPDIVGILLAAQPELDLFDAAAAGDVDRLAELLDADPSAVNDYAGDGFFPLALAAYFGHPGAVRLLLERGADVNQVATNPMQIQALHAAVAGRNADAVDALLAAGADPDAVQRDGYTPLMAARQHGDERMIAALIAAGANPG